MVVDCCCFLSDFLQVFLFLFFSFKFLQGLCIFLSLMDCCLGFPIVLVDFCCFVFCLLFCFLLLYFIIVVGNFCHIILTFEMSHFGGLNTIKVHYSGYLVCTTPPTFFTDHLKHSRHFCHGL